MTEPNPRNIYFIENRNVSDKKSREEVFYDLKNGGNEIRQGEALIFTGDQPEIADDSRVIGIYRFIEKEEERFGKVNLERAHQLRSENAVRKERNTRIAKMTAAYNSTAIGGR